MWGKQLLLALIGLSAGVTVAGGLFSFVVSLGVVSDFADRTHTGKHILLYEMSVAFGGIIGNILSVYEITIPVGVGGLMLFGIFAGIFVGCWSMALAEILNVFPIFIRRVKVLKGIPYIILSIAIGKGIGACLSFSRAGRKEKGMEKEKKEKAYEQYVKEKTPVHNVWLNMAKAFVTGGAICVLGQVILNYCGQQGLSKEVSGAWSSVMLVFLSVLLTGLGVYYKIAKWGGAGRLFR